MNDLITIALIIVFAWWLLGYTFGGFAEYLGNILSDHLKHIKELNDNLKLVAGFLEEIRDKLNN